MKERVIYNLNNRFWAQKWEFLNISYNIGNARKSDIQYKSKIPSSQISL